MDDLIPDFLAETNESLDELDMSLVELEQNPGNQDLLGQIFRVMHTIKGTSGFLSLPRLGNVAHKSEDLLGLFRDGKLQPNSEYISLILEALDTIKVVMAGIEETGSEPEGNDEDLISRLIAACEGDFQPKKQPAAEPEKPPEPDINLDENISSDSAELEAIFAAAPGPDDGDTNVAADPESEIEIPLAEAKAEKAVRSESVEAAKITQSLRVNVDVLEDLMTLVSELVLTRNQLLQVTRTHNNSEISIPLQRLNNIVSELQDGVMKTRMQPVGNAWSKLPRIIRDIANDLGKNIDLQMIGAETELDRQVLDMIKDPLTHMVRNSADHGIEMPEDRKAAGKPEKGTIRLESYHEGGYILIEIADDGKGLALNKIKEKIIRNGLATESELAEMSVQEIQQHIFSAGFSTAEKVTSVSGRGVGMDVVRTNIEKIGGSVEMDSVEGEGTTFTIKIPLTLAIVSSLIVGIGDERYAIPQLDVTELVMISPNSQNKIEKINGAPIFRLRGNVLPLICLRSLLGFEKATDENAPLYIAVINQGSHSFGVIVDRVFDTEEIVVKPTTSLLNNQDVFSGNTILGDGQVIMILDSAGLLKTSGIAGKSAIRKTNQTVDEENDTRKEETPLLLFNTYDDVLKAVPLEHVIRLEEIDLKDIEYAGNRRVIQYGNTLMPLHLHDQSANIPDSGRCPVIVFRTKDGLSGLLVKKILDITAHTGSYQIKSKGKLEGSAIIDGKTTDIINLFYEHSKNEAGNDTLAQPLDIPFMQNIDKPKASEGR